MREETIEALKPTMGQYVLMIMVREYPNNPVPYKYPPAIKESLASARASVTRSVQYSTNKTYNNTAIYGWDVDEERFVLLDFVPQDTHKDDLPWRRKRGK